MKTMAEFITAHGLTMESAPVPENPNMDDMSKESGHYHCTVRGREGAPEFTTYFSVGPGILDQWASKQANRPAVLRFKNSAVVEAMGKRYGERQTVDGAEIMDKLRAHARKHYRPDLESVLDCLASDASSVEGATFEDWAPDMGLDTDSRRAERTYRIIIEQANQLRALVGTPNWDSLLYDTERL
jgi:hypothetical protein